MQLGRIQSTLTAKCIFSCTFSCNWFCLGAFTYILGRYAAFKQSARVFRVSLLVFTVVCICILIGFVFVFDNNLSRWCWCVVGSWRVFSRAAECARRPGQRLCLLVSLNTFAPHFLVDYIWNKKMGGKSCIVHVCSTPPPNHVHNFPFKISNCNLTLLLVDT